MDRPESADEDPASLSSKASKPVAEGTNTLRLSMAGLSRGSAQIAATGEAYSLGACRSDGSIDELGECLRRVESRQAHWVEWWENREDGLEQGFDLKKAPLASSDGGPLRLELRVEGARVNIGDDGQRASFTLANGEQLQYAGLLAWDARGLSLPIRLVPHRAGLAIEVDDSGAEYPVRVDPLLTTPAWTAESNQVHGVMAAVTAAGDVNGDGYGDVLALAPLYDTGEENDGRVFVYHGGPNGLSTTATTFLSGESQSGANFGGPAAGAGDVNGDGYYDVVVAAPGHSNGNEYEGRVYVFHGGPSGLSTTASRILEVNEDFAHLGDVAAAGDVNNDGYADIIVGCGDCDLSGTPEGGRAFIYHGSATGIAATANRSLGLPLPRANFGASVTGAGDVNGDGYSDVVIGIPGVTLDQTNEGSVAVYYGSAAGIPAAGASLLYLNRTAARFGHRVAMVGDTNGDGYSDFLVSTLAEDVPNERVLLYRGSATGPLATYTVALRPATSQASQEPGSAFGESIAAAGDIDGDGLADVVVGAPLFTNGQSREGAAYIFYGSMNTGLSIEKREGEQAGAQFGNSVAGAGDVNGDGYGDVGVAAPFYANGQVNEGRAFVYHGAPYSGAPRGVTSTLGDDFDEYGAATESAGDVNGDGYDDLIVGAPGALSGQGRVYVLSGATNCVSSMWQTTGTAGSRRGEAVAGAGDVNGDGYADVLVGAPGCSNGETNEGCAYLYLGGPAGLASTPFFTLEANATNASLGRSVAAAGDVNGDGYGDVLIGAPGYNGRGRAYLFLGGQSTLSLSPGWPIDGSAVGDLFGTAVAGIGDANGNGYADVAVGAPNYDGGQTDEGAVFVYNGSASGATTPHARLLEANQAGAQYGFAVAAAGDVDADGFADVVVGAPNFQNGEPGEGAAFLHRGLAAGVSASAATRLEPNRANTRFGATVASAGDANGDGLAEVAIGAPGYDAAPLVDGGAVYVYAGNANGTLTFMTGAPGTQAGMQAGRGLGRGGDCNGDGYSEVAYGAPFTTTGGFQSVGMVGVIAGTGGLPTGLPLRLKQRRVTSTNFIAPQGRSDSSTGFQAVMLSARSPMGRTRVKIVVEAKSAGQSFDGTGTVRYPVWLDTGAAGTLIAQTITRPAGDRVHWRARLVYERSRSAIFQMSRWIYGGQLGDSRGVHLRIP